MKESGRSSQAGDIRAPERRCAVPFPQWGRQRGGGFAAKKEANPASLRSAAPSKGRGAWTLPPSYGRRCPEGAEVGWGKRYEKDRERSSQVRRLREHPIHRCAVPLPRVGKGASEASRIGYSRYEREREDRLKSIVYESVAILDIKPSPQGEGGERSEPDRAVAV